MIPAPCAYIKLWVMDKSAHDIRDYFTVSNLISQKKNLV